MWKRINTEQVSAHQWRWASKTEHPRPHRAAPATGPLRRMRPRCNGGHTPVAGQDGTAILEWGRRELHRHGRTGRTADGPLAQEGRRPRYDVSARPPAKKSGPPSAANVMTNAGRHCAPSNTASRATMCWGMDGRAAGRRSPSKLGRQRSFKKQLRLQHPRPDGSARKGTLGIITTHYLKADYRCRPVALSAADTVLTILTSALIPFRRYSSQKHRPTAVEFYAAPGHRSRGGIPRPAFSGQISQRIPAADVRWQTRARGAGSGTYQKVADICPRKTARLMCFISGHRRASGINLESTGRLPRSDQGHPRQRWDELRTSLCRRTNLGQLHEVRRYARKRIRRPGYASFRPLRGDGNLHIYLCKDDLSDRCVEEERRCHHGETCTPRPATWAGQNIRRTWHRPTAKRALPRNSRWAAISCALMTGIKRAFDPQGILNPGKVLPIITGTINISFFSPFGPRL